MSLTATRPATTQGRLPDSSGVAPGTSTTHTLTDQRQAHPSKGKLMRSRVPQTGNIGPASFEGCPPSQAASALGEVPLVDPRERFAFQGTAHPDDCPCVTFAGDAEVPTLMGTVVRVDACTNFGVGLSIGPKSDDGSGGYHTQMSIGQARQVAADLVKATDVIEASLKSTQAVNEPAIEWYPRECEYCTQEAALTCTDPVCLAAGYGQPHNPQCPALDTGLILDCACVKAVTR